MRFGRWAHSIIALALVGVLTSVTTSRAVAKDMRVIAFYDPDANHQAIVQITGWFNRYLQESGTDLLFQPVQSQQALEKLLEDPSTIMAMVSSSYLEQASSLRPMLVPTDSGSTHYRKQLMVRDANTSLAGKAIAATIASQNKSRGSEEVLLALQSKGVSVSGASVIPVAKDIDALMALTFGQVQAALVAPNSVEVIRRINPSAASSFRSMLETDPILRPPLCVVGERVSSQEIRSLISIFLQMGKDQNGKRAMNTLGFDDWTTFNAKLWEG